LAAVFVAGEVADWFAVVFLGTTLRAIGRGFGSGILGLAEPAAGQADNPMASTKVVAIAVDCNAAARADFVTAFLCGESSDGGGPRSI
jgi:hypothetical protein